MNLLLNRFAYWLSQCPDNARLVIWGQGMIGDQFASRVAASGSGVELLGFVDSSLDSPKLDGHYKVYPPSHLASLEPDALAIASVAYESEIMTQLADNGLAAMPEIFRSGDDEKLRRALAQSAPGDHQTTAEQVVDYPDFALTWRQLSQISEQPELRQLYSEVADCLEPQPNNGNSAGPNKDTNKSKHP